MLSVRMPRDILEGLDRLIEESGGAQVDMTRSVAVRYLLRRAISQSATHAMLKEEMTIFTGRLLNRVNRVNGIIRKALEKDLVAAYLDRPSKALEPGEVEEEDETEPEPDQEDDDDREP